MADISFACSSDQDFSGCNVATRLELVQALRLPTTRTERKIELAMSFIDSIRSHAKDGAGDVGSTLTETDSAWIKLPQVISFLSEWVQSTLVKSSKPGVSSHPEEKCGVPAHLDSRYWSILKFCLLSGYVHRITGISPSLMRPLTSCISSPLSENLKAELIDVVSVVFTEYSRPLRSNLDSWVSLTSGALNLLRPDGKNIYVRDSAVVELVSGIVEGFSKTVASHPNPSKLFQSIVARLLEPLLEVIGDSISNGNQSLSKVVSAAEDIIENSLFHSSHVVGYYEVCMNLKKKVDTNVNGSKNSEGWQRSYHRTLFQKLDDIRKSGNLVVLIGLGRIFKSYAKRWKAQQVALSEDVYGVRGQGKPELPDRISGDKAERNGEAKSSDHSGANIEGEKDGESSAPYPKRHANETDALFTVFGELLGPLIMELSSFVGSEVDKSELTEEQVITVSLLMRGVNELLTAAKESRAYKTIEDTLTLTYFNFLQEIFNLIIKVGTKAFDAWSKGDAATPVLKKKKRSLETESRVNRTNGTEVFCEVVFALQHLLELEYRVFEEQLSSIWMFVFKMVALSKEAKETTLKALEFCTGLVIMYSELRQVDIPIFHLTDTLTTLQDFTQYEVLYIPVQNIVCSKTFLATLGSVMHKLPEGQVANLLKGLRVAVGNSLDSFDSQQTTSLWRIKNFSGSAKGLSEVYTCILENANVTSSNSVLAGAPVRELIMKVLVPPMTDLVDVYGQSGTGSVGIDSSTQEHCVSAKTLFLLSMFVSSRVLHRRCLLLMPPKSARKARIFTLDVEINFLVADESGVISYSKASEFFLPLQRESLKMSTFLRKLLQSSVIGNGLHLPSMIYIINTIAIQSLVDLDRRICALKFLIGKVESKKYTKVLRSLEKEGAKLVYIVLQDLDAIKNEATSLTSVKWNRVLTSLDFSMIHVARWRLICDTVDVWSTFANEEQLKSFVLALLHIGKSRILDDAHNLHNSEEVNGAISVEESREVDLKDITDDLLKNLDFYELECIRRVFATAFLQELKKTLLSSFKEGCPIFNIIDGCIEGAAPPSAAESDAIFVEKVKVQTKSIAKLSTLKKLALNNEHQQTFRDCSKLLHVLASLPCGYLPSANNAGCAYIICQLEMVLVNFLLGDKEAVKHLKRSPMEAEPKYFPSDSVFFIWVDSVIACRRALHFLADSSASLEPSVVCSDFTRTVFGNSTRTQCVTLLPEIVAMRTLETSMGMDDKSPQGPSSVPFKRNASSVFSSLLNETCAIIEASIANICCAEAKVLVRHNASSHVPTPVELKSRKRKSKKLRAVTALGTVLVAEAMSIENYLKTEQSLKWYGPISTVAAISSTLWSMTMALERVDKECRASTSTSLMWRTELPEAWFFVVKELEPILVRILLQVLFPMGTTDLRFFTKTGVKASEVNDNVEQDLFGEDKFDGDELKDLQDEESLNVTSSDEESDDEDTEVQGVPEVDGHETEAMSEGLSFQALKTSVMEDSSSSQFAFLRSALEGSTREKTEFIGELYMAVAAIVKLRSLFYSPFSFTSVSPELTDFITFKEQSPHSLDTLLLAAYQLLSGSVQLIQTQKLVHPGWLVGVINYLGSVGAYLPCMKPFISPVDFVKLVNLHVELIGALLVLKENSATSTVKNVKDSILERVMPSDWNLDDHDVGGLEARRSKRLERVDQIDDLLFSIRRSFESLLRYSPRQHMVLALQSVEKAVAGVWGGSDPGLGFDISEVRGCHMGPVVAAGVDCIGLALQAVSGKMRLHLLASHCPAFYGGLLNLVAHCQGPSIFLERQIIFVSRTRRLSVVDAAPVVLRSLEILTSLAARSVIFPMKACFVAMALQCPAVLFRSFYDRGNPRAPLQDLKATMRESFFQGFSEMSVRLYVACCKLLCALLRHRIRECGHSMALLGESCRILLQCLAAPSGREEVNLSPSSTGAGATQCGSWLSRVYQEMETHKETMGKYCAHILADYLNVISGYNLGGSGLRREVDTALRSGAFALLDACSGNDLQQLHAALGEGARRSALTTLRHDYELHYKYSGKV